MPQQVIPPPAAASIALVNKCVRLGVCKSPEGFDKLPRQERDRVARETAEQLLSRVRNGELAWIQKDFPELVAAAELSSAYELPPNPHIDSPFPQITKRTLLYHVCPLKKNDLWERNVKQLLKRIDLFNGERWIAIAVQASNALLHPPDVVREAFNGHDVRFIQVQNCKRLREVASFLPLLSQVARLDPSEAVFYAHTKGNSTHGSVEGATYWRNAMYHYLLDLWAQRMIELETHCAVGTHRIIWRDGQVSPYPTRLRHGNWMFAGTFFWFRSDQVFKSKKWKNVPDDRYGAEAWLSGLFKPEECKSVYQPWPETMYPTPNPYDPSIYIDAIADD